MKPFDNLTFRCSSLGKIVGDKKGGLTEKQEKTLSEYTEKRRFKALTDKQEKEFQDFMIRKNAPLELPDTCTTYLKELYYQYTKGFYKEISSKYMEKGKFQEEKGITMLWKTTFHFMVLPPSRNEERHNNEFIQGEYDVKIGDVIIDIKNCFDWLTLDNAELNGTYYWQLMGYMWLMKCKEAILFYCLLNLPPHMILDECRKHFYAGANYLSFQDPEYLKACEEIEDKFNFEKYPVEERFKMFKMAFDQGKVDFLKTRIVECREWLNNYHEEQLFKAKENRVLMAPKQLAA